MFSSVLTTIVTIETIKVWLIALGILSAVACVVFWGKYAHLSCYNDDFTKTKKIILVFAIITSLIWPSCVAGYYMPVLDKNIVIARAVAVQMDKYAESHPESIYSPDVLLGSLDTVVKGIVDTSLNLPEYIKKLANGEIINFVSPKKLEDMSVSELQAEVKKLRENK